MRCRNGYLSLDRSGQDAAHEVALHREEHYQRQDHRDERGSRQQFPALPVLVDQISDCWHSESQGFESLQLHQAKTPSLAGFLHLGGFRLVAWFLAYFLR